MGVRHSYQSATANDPDAEVSADRWNADHEITGPVDWPVETATPSAPAAGDLRTFARNPASRVLPHWIGPTGLDTAVQPALFGNGVILFLPNHVATGPLSLGMQWNGAGTLSHPVQAAGSPLGHMNKSRYTSAATASSACGVRAARASSMREAGFFMFARLAISTFLSDMQLFAGMSAESNAIPGDPSTTMLSALGIGKDSADSQLQIISRTHNGTATKVSTGYAPKAGDLLDFWLFSAPAGSDVCMRLVNRTTDDVIVDNVVVSATLPGSTAGLFTHVGARTVQAAAVAIDIGRIYVEQDI